MTSSASSVTDRAVGSLLGLAVGDAIGTTLEFSDRDSRHVTDMVGGGPFGLRAGRWTDDTAMALALADSLAADPALNERDLMARFVDWWRNGTYSCTGECFDIGETTRRALRRFETTGDPVAGDGDERSAGNGSLMRLAPVAICHLESPERRKDVAERQSRTTHGAPQAVAACIVFADALADAMTGLPRDRVLGNRDRISDPAIAAIMTGSWRGKSRDGIRSSGYVAHSLEAALWCVDATEDFQSAVLLAANLGDDADTTAAITGQLAGALYGRSGIPEEWLNRLAWRDRIERAARALL